MTPSSKQLVGTMTGTAIVGAADHFIHKYGRAAGQEVFVRMADKWRAFVDPHAPAFGLLGSKRYPLAMVGDLIRHSAVVAKARDEDAFIRELGVAGIDAAINTVMRVLLRYAATPEMLAERGTDSWRMFFDTGRVQAVAGPKEYSTTIYEWTGHDVYVCKISLEVRRRLLERTGKKIIEARREKCLAWGHDVCLMRLKW